MTDKNVVFLIEEKALVKVAKREITVYVSAKIEEPTTEQTVKAYFTVYDNFEVCWNLKKQAILHCFEGAQDAAANFADILDLDDAQYAVLKCQCELLEKSILYKLRKACS